MTNETISTEIHNRIHHLREGYVVRTADDIQSLIGMLEPYQTELPLLVRDELRMRLHRVAGSAGSFGFTEMGARARLLELRMVPDVECIDISSLRSSLEKLHKLVDSLREPQRTQELVGQSQSIDSNIPLIDGIGNLRLLIGGDDPNYCQLLAALLGTSFSVALAHSGEEVLGEYRNADADIILLDVGLPDMSGYHVCQQMDQIRERQWRSVVFVSVNNGVDDKVAAYEAGGDDFIAKPIQLDEFVAKLKTLAAYTQSKKNLLSQSQFAQKLAFDSMAEIAQYGRLVDFMRSAMGCRDHDGLAVVFFDAMDALGLKASLRLGSNSMVCLAAPNQPCSPIESNLLETFAGKDRLQHLGMRTLVNGRHTSFLVKNMPVNDDVAYGRLKDLVAVMVEALDACYVSVARQQALSSGVTGVGNLLQRLAEGVLAEGGSVQVAVRRLEELMRDLEAGFHFLDLNEEQEKYLYGLLSRGAEDAVEIVQVLAALREDLSDINRNLMRYAK